MNYLLFVVVLLFLLVSDCLSAPATLSQLTGNGYHGTATLVGGANEFSGQSECIPNGGQIHQPITLAFTSNTWIQSLQTASTTVNGHKFTANGFFQIQTFQQSNNGAGFFDTFDLSTGAHLFCVYFDLSGTTLTQITYGDASNIGACPPSKHGAGSPPPFSAFCTGGSGASVKEQTLSVLHLNGTGATQSSNIHGSHTFNPSSCSHLSQAACTSPCKFDRHAQQCILRCRHRTTQSACVANPVACVWANSKCRHA